MRVALDTNVLAYAEGVNGSGRKKATLDLLAKLPDESTFIPVQVLGELFQVLVAKAGRTREKAYLAVLSWQDAFPLVETSPSVLLAAIGLAKDHELRIWDAILLAGAAEAGCRVLLSEDLQAGFTWNGVTVVNPYAEKKRDLLASFFEG